MCNTNKYGIESPECDTNISLGGTAFGCAAKGDFDYLYKDSSWKSTFVHLLFRVYSLWGKWWVLGPPGLYMVMD